MLAIIWGFRKRNPHKVNRWFRLAQTVSAAAMTLGHGLQDAQKTTGVIFLALAAGGYVSGDDRLPIWVIAASAGAISLGTYSGGWRIMRTLGRRIIHLDPPRGFASETAAASVLYVTAFVPRAHLHHAYDHLGHHGRRRDPAVVRGPVVWPGPSSLPGY